MSVPQHILPSPELVVCALAESDVLRLFASPAGIFCFQVSSQDTPWGFCEVPCTCHQLFRYTHEHTAKVFLSCSVLIIFITTSKNTLCTSVNWCLMQHQLLRQRIQCNFSFQTQGTQVAALNDVWMEFHLQKYFVFSWPFWLQSASSGKSVSLMFLSGQVYLC